MRTFHKDAMGGLILKNQIDLLDSVDQLRSQGISHYVSLPQIIVCGDQSSGKSSVLEALSGVSFPVKSNLCTRFPTELVLRKAPKIEGNVWIVPHESCTDSERLSLTSFREKLDDFEQLPALIEKARTVMGISTAGKAFSKDLLHIEVSGPDRPHLTIVDLPGLIHSETKQQSASDVDLVRDVVETYMKEPRSIILAVVSAKNDISNQIVLKLAREADPKGIRTLGVITKPDTLIANSASEAMYVSLASNEEFAFRLGWHVLKNMDSETGEFSLDYRAVREEEFFSQGVWVALSRSLLGIDRLRSRLSKVLVKQIAAELPSLIDEIGAKSNACRSRLIKLGATRATFEQQKLYLVRIGQNYQSLVKAAVDGTYTDPFFEDAKSENGYQKRIRAVVQNLNLAFAEDMASRGQYRQISDSQDNTGEVDGVLYLTRDEVLSYIQDLMKKTRGRELPGTFNPMIVSDLFREQSIPWESITQSHISAVWKATKEFLNLTTIHIADSATSNALLQEILQPALDQLLQTLNSKATNLLCPHQKSHPISYNHYFTENLQKARNARSRDNFSVILKRFFGESALAPSVHINGYRDLRPLLEALVNRTEPDMNLFAASEALDCTEAYYKVALKRFIDDIAIEAIEATLISKLSEIFSPVTVSAMPADLITRIAGDSEDNQAQRIQLTKQLDVLMKGSDTCKRFIGARIIDTDDVMIESDPQLNNDSVNHAAGSSDFREHAM